MSDAKWSIDSDLGDYGYDAALGATLTLAPKASPGLDIQTYTFTVVAKIDAAPDIPELPLGVPAALTPTPLTPLDITFPGSGPLLAYKIRGQINGGTRKQIGPNGQEITVVVPEWTWERIIVYRTPSGQRPMVKSERFEYDPDDGWTSAINDMVDNWGAGAVVGPVSSTVDAVSTWGNTLGGTLLDNPLVRIQAGKLLLGSNPPSNGALNFSNQQSLYWETVVPAGNARVLTVDNGDNLILGSADVDITAVFFQAATTSKCEFQVGGAQLRVQQGLTSALTSLAVGATPADSGSVRLSKQATVRFNNNAGLEYIPAIATDVGDRLLLGGNYVGNAGMSLDVKAAHTIELNVAGTTELTVAGGKATVANELEVDGTLNHDGANLGFRGVAPVAISAAYTPTNVATDRSYDANATTIHELADVLGTLISDLQAQGLLGS